MFYGGTSIYQRAKGLAKICLYNDVLFHVFYYIWGAEEVKKKIIHYSENFVF